LGALVLGASAGEGLTGYAIPRAAFDTDDGLGGGFEAALARRAPDHDPFLWQASVGSYLTLEGYQDHRFRYERTGRVRVQTAAAFRAWRNDGFWGIGGDTVRERAFVGEDVDGADRKQYRYQLIQPYVQGTVRVGEPWATFGALTGRYSFVDSYASSLLADERVYGEEGGLLVQGTLGALYDTREPEVRPRAGMVFEASARVSPPLPGDASGFGGPLVSLRAFHSLGDRVVLAGRAMTEHLFGPVPFYEMITWGGYEPVLGFGGAQTIRGVDYGRWRAPGKAVTNLELRVDAIRHRLLKKPFVWEVAPFVDGGFVYGKEAGALVWHPAVGLGVRPVFDEIFVFRIDGAAGIDPVREESGEIVNDVTTGFYVTFGYAF
jgi:hypothetical protein